MANNLARTLRKNATTAERILWSKLRNLKASGLHFRRQAPIGCYIVDFVCRSTKIVIEVDGSQHGTPEALRQDAERTAFLNFEGYRVIRFWNVDVIRNSDGIADAIRAAAISPPGSHQTEIAARRISSPTSPQGGGRMTEDASTALAADTRSLSAPTRGR